MLLFIFNAGILKSERKAKLLEAARDTVFFIVSFTAKNLT